MAFGMSEELFLAFVPIAVYWLLAGIYHVTLNPMEQNRLFTKEEEETQNLATPRQVFVGVLINHAAQMVLAVLLFMVQPGGGGMASAGAGATARAPSLLKVAGQIATAILVVDCWQYFWHRLTHENEFLYKHVHAMHHHLIVPYTYGAQYGHPLDSFVADVIGSLLAVLASGMSPRTGTLFFCLLTFKVMDDHCGMWFPNHPFHRWMINNSAFHALHHQHSGIKHNYSAHFLATWDLLLGTYMPFSVEERKGGGYQIRTAKDQ